MYSWCCIKFPAATSIKHESVIDSPGTYLDIYIHAITPAPRRPCATLHLSLFWQMEELQIRILCFFLALQFKLMLYIIRKWELRLLLWKDIFFSNVIFFSCVPQLRKFQAIFHAISHDPLLILTCISLIFITIAFLLLHYSACKSTVAILEMKNNHLVRFEFASLFLGKSSYLYEQSCWLSYKNPSIK